MNEVLAYFNSMIFEGMESMGRYYSSYRAIVYSVDDPKNISRLQLIIPEITSTGVYSYWAFPKGVFGGITSDGVKYGMQVLPQPGDMVWVEFERGEPERPIWQHGHYAENEKPDDGDFKDARSYFFKTPGGNSVLINDTKNHVTVTLSSGQSFKIDPDAFSVIHDKAISMGKEKKSDEPAVLGKKHNDHEAKTLQAIKKLTVGTAFGPSSVPLNISEFIAQEQSLPDILSTINTLD